MTLGLLVAASLAAAAPAPNDCQAALGPLHGGSEESALPNQVDGASLRGRDALVALRRAHGDALITVKGGDFSGADFRGARLANICFLDTNLASTDWRGVEAPGLGFVRANLSGARLAGARLDRILIRNANMDNADGARAHLAGGRLDGGWFEGSLTDFRLDGADLTDFRFDCGITLDDGCPVYQGEPQVSLRGADLTRANFRSADDLTGARIDGTEAEPSELHNLRVADIRGPIRVAGGDSAVTISPADYRALLPHLRDPQQSEPPPLPGPRALPAWVRPGAIALFVDGPLVFADAFRATALYRRLLPALIGASWSRVVVRVRADSRIDAAGDALGSNAHSCSLSGERLALDPQTGFYSGPREPRPDDPPAWRGRPVPVLRLQGDRAEVFESGRAIDAAEGAPWDDYASCGARAAFQLMVRVPISEAEARQLLAELSGD